MATQSQNTFNFDKYNKVLTNAGPGLKLFLAEQMLTQVQSSMVYFNNPLANDINDVVSEIRHVRMEGKKQAEKRANAGNTEEIDNATVDGAMTQASNSADGGKVDATK